MFQIIPLYVLRSSLCIFVCIFLQACALDVPESPKTVDLVGLQGDVQADAGQAFAKADVLWGGGLVCAKPLLAFDYLDEALRIEPAYANALVRRAMLSLQVGYLEDALDDATKAIRLDAGSAAYAVRALVLLVLGHRAGALKDLEQAERLGLNSSLARLLVSVGRPELIPELAPETTPDIVPDVTSDVTPEVTSDIVPDTVTTQEP